MTIFKFNISICDDDLYEANETFKLHISQYIHEQVNRSDSNYAATIKIVDDETRECMHTYIFVLLFT